MVVLGVTVTVNSNNDSDIQVIILLPLYHDDDTAVIKW